MEGAETAAHLKALRHEAFLRVRDYFENYTDDGESFTASGAGFTYSEYAVVAGVAAEPAIEELGRSIAERDELRKAVAPVLDFFDLGPMDPYAVYERDAARGNGGIDDHLDVLRALVDPEPTLRPATVPVARGKEDRDTALRLAAAIEKVFEGRRVVNVPAADWEILTADVQAAVRGVFGP